MEAALIDTLGGAVTYDDGLVSFFAVENSFNVIASQAIFSDLSTVVLGFCIVLVYVVTMLGNFFHKIENRVRESWPCDEPPCLTLSRFLQVYLSIIGLGSLYMGIGCAYSLTASMGFPFSPLHSFIPFLLVGLGTEKDVSVNS